MLYMNFCTIMAISRQLEAQSWDSALLFLNDFQGFFIAHSTIDSTLRAFEQFGALHMEV